MADDVEVVEADVEEARARLANTISKLTSPDTVDATKKEVTGIAQGYKDDVLRQVMGYRDGVVYDVRQRVLNNPLPVALIGAGIAWRLYRHPPITTLLVGTGVALLMRGGGSAGGDRRAYRDPYRRSQPRGYVPGGVAGYGYPVEENAPGDTTTERLGAAATDVGHRAVETGTRLRDAAYEARSQIAEATEWAGTQAFQAAGDARTRVSETTARAGSAAAEMYDQATTRLSHAAESVTAQAGGALEAVQRNPLALGAIGVVAGLALGRSIRATETGDYYAEATADAFGRGARGVGRGARFAASRAGSLASDAVETVGRAASTAGATAADLVGTVARRAPELAEDAAEAVSDAAETATERARHAVSSAGPDVGPASRPRPAGRAPQRRPQGRRQPERARSFETGEWLEHQTRELSDRYPLLLGAIGLVVGAVIGGSIGRTETENSTFGAASDRLKARARDLATERFDDAVGAFEQLAEELQGGEPGGKPKASAEPSDFETVLGGGEPPVPNPGGRDPVAPRPGAANAPKPRPPIV